MKPLFYLSFASEAGFLGVAIVEADDFLDAVKCAHELGINPGGQVLGFPLPKIGTDGMTKEAHDTAVANKNKLLSAVKLHEMGWI